MTTSGRFRAFNTYDYKSQRSKNKIGIQRATTKTLIRDISGITNTKHQKANKNETLKYQMLEKQENI